MIRFFKDQTIFRQLVSNINYKYSQLLLPLLYLFLQIIFLQPVCLSHQSFDAVAVNCFFKIFAAYRKAGLQRSS